MTLQEGNNKKQVKKCMHNVTILVFARNWLLTFVNRASYIRVISGQWPLYAQGVCLSDDVIMGDSQGSHFHAQKHVGLIYNVLITVVRF
jgi:hypothetical protein